MRGGGIVLVLLLGLLGSTAVARAPRNADRAEVTHVTDGDTAYLKPLRYGKRASSWPGRSARFIGVDTPEIYSGPDCYGAEAAAFTERQLDGAAVKVTYGRDPEDQYERALVYVWLKGRLFNAILIRRGFARASFYSPNYRYQSWFERLESDARREGRGLWSACR